VISDLRGTSRRTITKSLRSAGLATVVQYACSFALAPVVFALAGASTFGAWATIASILAVGALADAGLRLEISRRVAEAAGEGDTERMKRVVHDGTTLLCCIAFAVFALGSVLAPVIRGFAFPSGMLDLSNFEADLLLRATFAILAFSLVTDGYFAVLRGVQRGDVETNGRMVSVVCGTALSLAGLELGWGIWALLAGAAAMNIVAVAFQAIATRRVVPEVGFRLRSLRGTKWQNLLAFSSLALLSQLSDVVDSQWDKLVLSRYVGSSAVASFQLGTTLALQAKALALLPVAPLLVAVAELRRRDPALLARLLRSLSSATFALAALALSGVVAFAPAFLRLWIGEDLPQAVTAARLFSIAIALNLVAAPLAYRALAEGKHRLTAIASGCNIAVNAVTSYVLTIAVGFRGPLVGSIVGNLCGTVVFFVLMARSLQPDMLTQALRCVAVGVAAAVAAIAAGSDAISTWTVFAVAVIAFSATVGSLLSWMGVLPVREIIRRDMAAVR
jgi:O-antigen/teichoic acid export membrane protein